MRILVRLAFALIASIALGTTATFVTADLTDTPNGGAQDILDSGKEIPVLSGPPPGSLRGLQGAAEVNRHESVSRDLATMAVGPLRDWERCSASAHCGNQCCSKKYSHDGQLKCTPVGGYKPSEGCVRGTCLPSGTKCSGSTCNFCCRSSSGFASVGCLTSGCVCL
jgi:hypothetical protein